MAEKNPALQFSVMCLNLVEDEKKPPTLQYIFYELPFPQLPFRMDRFHVINCWTSGKGAYKQSVKILNPAKTKVFIETGEQPFVLENEHIPQLMINVFADLEFAEEGHYWVQTFLDDKLVLEYPLTVRLTDKGKKQPQTKTAEKEKEKPKKATESLPTGPIFIPDEWNVPQ